MRSVSIETAKDKRTLVLFVLGLLLMVFDWWNFTSKELQPQHSLTLEEKTKPWSMLTVPTDSDQGNATAKGRFDLKEHSSEVSPVSEQEATDATPAALSLFFNRPLPINAADKETLEMLPGVGPHLAASIASELQRQGRFTGPDDLLKVPGIGPKSLQRLLPLISFE